MVGKSIIEGNWEFVLNLHTTDPVRYELGREYQVAGCPAMVKSVELTPISAKLICDEEDARQLEK